MEDVVQKWSVFGLTGSIFGNIMHIVHIVWLYQRIPQRKVFIPTIKKIYSGVLKIFAKKAWSWWFWPEMVIFGKKEGDIFLAIFWVVIKVAWRPNFMQRKNRKKPIECRPVGPERIHTRTNRLTDTREWIYRFLPESKDIWGAFGAPE